MRLVLAAGRTSSRSAVRQNLDLAAVARAVPGCRSVTPAEGGGVRIVVDVAIASVRGLWAGTITETGPGAWRVVGAGEPGRADLSVRIDGDGDGSLTVNGTVEGPVADIGSALLAAAVRRMVLSSIRSMAASQRRQFEGGAP